MTFVSVAPYNRIKQNFLKISVTGIERNFNDSDFQNTNTIDDESQIKYLC